MHEHTALIRPHPEPRCLARLGSYARRDGEDEDCPTEPIVLRLRQEMLFQDQNEWQIEWQTGAREGLSGACERWCVLAFCLVKAPYLR